jgi:hypothetical protein
MTNYEHSYKYIIKMNLPRLVLILVNRKLIIFKIISVISIKKFIYFQYILIILNIKFGFYKNIKKAYFF